MLFTKSHGYLYLILNAYLIGCYSGDNMLGILVYVRSAGKILLFIMHDGLCPRGAVRDDDV
jgi:hypothetical protein